MDIYDVRPKADRLRCEVLCKLLESHGFKAQYTEDKAAACEAALKLIPQDASVGVPGTVTVREIGLYGALKKRGNKISDHWESQPDPEEKQKTWIGELMSDWFIMSTNALSVAEGIFVNIDGTGNRVGAMSWAPGKLLIIAGINKLAPDIHAAIGRARDEASVTNAVRFSADTPCTKTGRCVDCSSPHRICNIVTLLERAPIGREVHVILVGEPLGY